MRALLVALIVVIVSAIDPARADASSQASIWNTTIKTGAGSSTKLTVFGDNPYKLFPACRCVAGTWKLARDGESATHFTGTLRDLSFNHPRRAGDKLSVKVRKTRQLMHASRKYRDKLHAIMRGSGQLILREVTGGEWEIVGFSPDALGDLFALRPRWNADGDRPPRPSPATPFTDPIADAATLAKLINDYRASRKLPRVRISPSLTKVARAHVRDLNANHVVNHRCNMHSWSKSGAWTGCCYDKSRAAARCMWSKPKEIAGYRGNGYEIAASASGIVPAQALEQWQNSPAHHEIILGAGKWTTPWAAMGVAIEGDYAVAWFGEIPDAKK